MHPQVVVSLLIGLEITDPDILADAALARYKATMPSSTPSQHVEAFTNQIRTDPAVAVHQFLFEVCEAAFGQIPGCHYVGSTITQRVADPDEALPWRHG